MKDKRTIVLRLAAQGMNSSQIARETGFSTGSVYYYMHPEKYKKQEITSICVTLSTLYSNTLTPYILHTAGVAAEAATGQVEPSPSKADSTPEDMTRSIPSLDALVEMTIKAKRTPWS